VAPIPFSVPPNKTAERLVTFHPPRVPTSAATNYDYLITATPQHQERNQASLGGTLRVFPYFAYKDTIDTSSRGVRITITNQGNSQRYYVIEVRESRNALIVLPSRSRTLIAPNQSTAIDVRVLPKRRPVFGSTRHYPLELFLRTDGLRPQTRTVEFPVRPVVPWEAIALLVLAVAAVIAVLMTLLRG
jgi:hypothetical protein